MKFQYENGKGSTVTVDSSDDARVMRRVFTDTKTNIIQDITIDLRPVDNRLTEVTLDHESSQEDVAKFEELGKVRYSFATILGLDPRELRN